MRVTGYCRGLDALGGVARGIISSKYESNQGFLRVLKALRQAAGCYWGEKEVVRIDDFLREANAPDGQ